MQIMAQLDKPYTEEERMQFILDYNTFPNQYIIEYRDDCMVALWYTAKELEEQRREYLDSLTLTPSDVERALYKAKDMDFEDLKAVIHQYMPTLDMKALAIEFRANNFYRGVEINGMRLFDVVGQLLGYTSDDIDYLFENKELPNPEEEPEEEEE